MLCSHRAAQPAEQRVERTGFKVDNRHGMGKELLHLEVKACFWDVLLKFV